MELRTATTAIPVSTEPKTGTVVPVVAREGGTGRQWSRYSGTGCQWSRYSGTRCNSGPSAVVQGQWSWCSCTGCQWSWCSCTGVSVPGAPSTRYHHAPYPLPGYTTYPTTRYTTTVHILADVITDTGPGKNVSFEEMSGKPGCRKPLSVHNRASQTCLGQSTISGLLQKVCQGLY